MLFFLGKNTLFILKICTQFSFFIIKRGGGWFNKAHICCEGWVFSNRFSRALNRLTELIQGFKDRKDSLQKQKDRDLFMYL